jgi:hypothetical protein
MFTTKYVAIGACMLLGLSSYASADELSLNTTDDMTPVNRVLNLIKNLEKEVEKDGKMEQKSYDKYACWCESTLERKAKDIADAKVKIEKLTEHIQHLKGDLGGHSAEIASLKKWISENEAAQKDATDVRDKEYAAFEAEKTENEQCTGALEAAIKVLTGAGTFIQGKKAGFLEMHDAQLLGVAADLRRVLKQAVVGKLTSEEDLSVLTRFVERPQDFTPRTSGSLAQVNRHNPFGEYAPQSTQIQGILKGMYDAFTADIEKDNAEEADKQKGFEAFIATKQKELATLKETLKNQELDEALKAKDEADSQTERDDTQAQLAADEEFFEITKETCRVKAQEWSERSRLRSEELVGIGQAIAIIDSPESRAIFANSSTTLLELPDSKPPAFLQIDGVSAHYSVAKTATTSRRALVYAKLRSAAGKSGNLDLARIAAVVKMGGHFDKVIVMIEDMIALLRKEEARDIMHRDLCQNGQTKNALDMAEDGHIMEKTAAAIDELNMKVKLMQEEIKELERAISDTEMDMEERLEMRNKEQYAFEQSVKDDVAAIDIVNKAIVALSAFYKKNKIDIALLGVRKQPPGGPEYTVDSDKAPELAWGGEGGAYGGRKSDTGGLLAIMEMIVTDIENEVATARKDDAAAEAEYEKERAAMKAALDSQMATKVATEQAVADANLMIAEKQALYAQTEEELGVQKSLMATLATDCKWVTTNFESRRTKRKTEMDGLADAKAILAGANVGNYDALTVATSR